jgi:hypothetical protein
VLAGLARATRNYIDIIGGFVGHLLWCCVDRQWCALRTHLHFSLKTSNRTTIDKIINQSRTAPHQTFKTSVYFVYSVELCAKKGIVHPATRGVAVCTTTRCFKFPTKKAPRFYSLGAV